MKYEVFSGILNRNIFEKSKPDLLEKISKNPFRYMGLFRPAKPKAKITQNILHSNEIRFGDCLEYILELYFIELGYKILPKKIDFKGDTFDIDQLFSDNENIYFVEQKVRDDHDSTKKTGQNINFETKVEALLNIYGEKKLRCFVYFIDKNFKKNRRYYTQETEMIENNYNISAKLCYGKEFWELINHPEIWDEIVSYMERWREEIPEFPIINFDLDPKISFEEIKDIKASIIRKLFDYPDIREEILPVLFPENKTLVLLASYYKNHESNLSIYKNLSEKIYEYVNSKNNKA